MGTIDREWFYVLLLSLADEFVARTLLSNTVCVSGSSIKKFCFVF